MLTKKLLLLFPDDSDSGLPSDDVPTARLEWGNANVTWGNAVGEWDGDA